MSVSYRWQVVEPEKSNCFSAGTSNDQAALTETFGDPAIISAAQLPLVRAMHRATCRETSLWSCIVDALERLDELRNYDGQAKIKVWGDYG